MSWKDDWNKWIGSGRLTRKPELRRTPSGTCVCDLFIACNRFSAANQQYTTFVTVTIWDKQAEVLGDPERGLNVGDYVEVEGTLVDDNFQIDRNDPNTMTRGLLKIDRAWVKTPPRKVIKADAPTEGNQSN